MKKYSIVINHIENDLYALVMKRFDLIDGVTSNEETKIYTKKSLAECIELQTAFING